jgi:hypothetical protein
MANFDGEIITAHIRGTRQWVIFFYQLGEEEGLISNPRADETIQFWREISHSDLIDIHIHNHPRGINLFPSFADVIFSAASGGRQFLLTNVGVIEYDGGGLTDLNGRFVWPVYYDNVAFGIVGNDSRLQDKSVDEKTRKGLHYSYYKKINFKVQERSWAEVNEGILNKVDENKIVADLNSPRPQTRLRGLARISEFPGMPDSLYYSILGWYAKHDADLGVHRLVYDQLQRVFWYNMKGDSRPKIVRKIMRDLGLTEDPAMLSVKGGIDLAQGDRVLEVNSTAGRPIQFDPVAIERFRDLPGLTPVIIDIEPMTMSVAEFAGVRESAGAPH